MGIVLMVLLLGMLSFTFTIQQVKASGTIYIRADGSIDPAAANITTTDNITYTFVGDNNEPIFVERDNIIVDGNGHMLRGNGSGYGREYVGFRLRNRGNVTIKNMNIKGFTDGIYLENSSYITISGNNITNNNWHGIEGGGVFHSTISGNNIAANNAYSGIWISSGSYDTFSENTITGAEDFGIIFFHGLYNAVLKNNITNNDVGVQIRESDNSRISGNIITWNKLIGVNLYIRCHNNTVSGNTIENNYINIHFRSSSDNHIYHNDFINIFYQCEFYSPGYANFWDDGYPSGGNYWSNYTGVDLYSGPYQNETGSDEIGDTPYVLDENNRDNYPLMHPWGLSPVHNINTKLGYNTIQEAINADETLDGHTIFVQEGTYYEHVIVSKSLLLFGAHKYSTIIDGNLTGNVVNIAAGNVNITGFTIENSGYPNSGVYVSSSGNNISCNVITTNYVGVNLSSFSYNTLSGNDITDNTNGVALYHSYNNSIFHNNFMDNFKQAYLYISSYANFWDDGYPSGGNYWSNYTGVDLYSGPYQNENGMDGVGDRPYTLNANNYDNYPLMNPWPSAPPVPTRDIAITDVQPSDNVVVQNHSVSINVTVANQGTFIETFEVTAYYGSVAIETKNVTSLAPNTETALTFNWSTTGVHLGNHVISAKASTVPEELQTADNTYIDGTIHVCPDLPSDKPTLWAYNYPFESVATYLNRTSFNVTVNIFNATDVRGCAIKLGYNNTLVEAVGVSSTDITKDATTWLPVDTYGVFHWDDHPTINNMRTDPATGLAYVWIGFFWGFTSFTGSGELFTINFIPKVLGNSTLHLFDTEVLNPNADPIEHYTLDGSVTVLPGVRSVKITNVTLFHYGELVSETYWTWTVEVNVTVHNNGTALLDCTVNVYYFNATHNYQIGKAQSITNLLPYNSETLTFYWNCSGLPVGVTYTVKANATCDSGAKDEYTYGQVKVRPWGDINGIGGVSIADVKIMDLVYSGISPNPDYDIWSDINGDCKVSIADAKVLDLVYSGFPPPSP